MLTVLRRAPEDARKRGVPDGFESGIIGLAFLQRPQSFTMQLLDMVNALQLHLDIV
jgi:hypothetical protein